MSKALTSLLICLLIAAPAWLWAAEDTLVLSDGSAVKVLFFQPQGPDSPPLALLVSGGMNNEFMARAQFWLGKEMVDRGWAIAVPISPRGRMYFVDNPQLFPEIIARLHDSYGLRVGKTLLVGISNGGSAALAIAAQQPQHYLGVVAAPGRIFDQDKFRSLQGLPVYLRVGEHDNYRWNRKLEQTVNVLHGAGASVDAALIPGAKHIFPLDWENLEGWLSGLQQPR